MGNLKAQPLISARLMVGAVCGASVAVAAWILIVATNPVFFGRLSLSGLLAPIIAGMAGGFVAALAAPHHKVGLAAVTGVALTAILLAFMLRHGFTHAERNPLLWYWPIWLAPSFSVGGFLAGKVRVGQAR